MSNERPSPDTNGVTDPVVSQAYRETADERVPPELDRAVLSSAASAARPGYARSIVWLRPLAWAATIGLSLAIVLELTRVPQPEPSVFEIPAAASDAPEEKKLLDEIDKATTAEPRRQDVDSFAIETVPEDSSVKLESSLPASRPAPSLAIPDAMERTRGSDSNAESPETSGSLATESFNVENVQLLRQAEDLARIHSDNLVETAQPTLRSVTTQSISTQGNSEDCDEDETATPSIWLECIEDLEKAGLVDAARRERERLLTAFPHYELP
jgi:hypothetical protein